MEDNRLITAKSKVCNNSIIVETLIRRYCSWCGHEHSFFIEEFSEDKS